MNTSDWLSALLIGFLGSAHCIGMCGGIASLMGFTCQTSSQRLMATIMYNLGRIVSYSVAGMIVGGAFASAAGLVSDITMLNWLRLFSGVVLIIIALYIGQWWQGLTYIEQAGSVLWNRLSPVAQGFIPLRSPVHAFPAGLVWGWLPCGLVYSTLTWAAISGSVWQGGLTMLAFGLGTLPSMLIFGLSGGLLSQIKNNRWFRQIGALILLVYGVLTFVSMLRILV